jgi:hypothetical protein
MAEICEVEGCETWVGRPRQRICIDCKRIFKKVRLIACQYPDCKTLIPEGRNRHYCMEYTALRRPA